MTLENFCEEKCFISHEEIEKMLDDALKPDLILEYDSFMYKVKDNYPRFYRILKALKVPHPY
jgi:hypothetical protein